jgi:hypothetical protein
MSIIAQYTVRTLQRQQPRDFIERPIIIHRSTQRLLSPYSIHTNTMSESEQPRRRHGAPVLSVEQFAHRKGVTKAIQSFRKRKEKKQLRTATALRSYKKVMKQEGYEPGQGASRKRVEGTEESTEATQPSASAASVAGAEASSPLTEKPARRQKSNPFQKSIQKADDRKKNIQQAQEDRESRESERNGKLRERKHRHKLLTKRTRKGQPIMKNVVEDILSKLQREQEF